MEIATVSGKAWRVTSRSDWGWLGGDEPSPALLNPPESLLKLDRERELMMDSYFVEQLANDFAAETQAEFDSWNEHELETDTVGSRVRLIGGAFSDGEDIAHIGTAAHEGCEPTDDRNAPMTDSARASADSSVDQNHDSILCRTGTYGHEYFHDMLASAVPGNDLGLMLASIDVQSLSDYELVDYVAACTRQESWLYARKLDAVAELSDRPAMWPEWPTTAGVISELNVVVEEIAMRLPCSRMAAQQLVDTAKAFDGPLGDTGRALSKGGLSVANAQVVFKQLHYASVEAAQLIQDKVLPAAARRTPTQLRRDIERASIEVDAVDYAHRRVAARKTRRVDRPRPLGNGLASWYAVLPAADALVMDTVLDSHARKIRGQGDSRTLDQLRADLLVATLLSPTRAGRNSEDGSDGSDGSDCSDNLARDRESVPRMPVRAQIHVTVPLSTLLGTSDEAGEVAGYGPIDPTTARALAAGGVWRRIVTDPVTETVLNVGRTTYRPPVALADHVKVRDKQCARPGCSTPAVSADLDHTVEFHRHSGTTADDNLGPLCRRDHQIKTDGGHQLTQHQPGIYTWQTPTGHVYLSEPGRNGRHVHLGSTDGAVLGLTGGAVLGLTDGAGLGLTGGAGLGLTGGAVLGLTDGAGLGLTGGAVLGLTDRADLAAVDRAGVGFADRARIGSAEIDDIGEPPF